MCGRWRGRQKHGGGADLRSMSATLMVDGLMHGARLRNTWDTTEASIAFQAAGLCRSKDVEATLSSRETLAQRLWALNTQCTRLYLCATALAPYLRRTGGEARGEGRRSVR